MAANIYEFFGYPAKSSSPEAKIYRKQNLCPFVEGKCIKTISVGDERCIAGVCSIKPATSDPVVTCPHRMYGNNYEILKDVARIAFDAELELVSGHTVEESKRSEDVIAVFGHRMGRELRLPRFKGRGGYFVDWILARLSASNELLEFTAVEVQTIDTTGNYRDEFQSLRDGLPFKGRSTASPNWENVNKRILPQLIYKGHVLRREPKCHKGLFFVSPSPVFRRIQDRLGQDLTTIHPSPGSLTFLHYDLGQVDSENRYALSLSGQFTTTVDQVALAFTAPKNLPPAGAYETAIKGALGMA